MKTTITKEPQTSSLSKKIKTYGGPLVSLPSIIGGPPKTYISNVIRDNTTPIMEIWPMIPDASMNEAVFTLKDADDYVPLLQSHGFTTSLPLRVAFQADSFPTDTFNNEYGESFLSKITDVVSGGVGEINQMFGSARASETLKSLGEKFGSSQNPMISTTGKMFQNVMEQGKALKDSLSNVDQLKGLMGTVDKMLGGQRVDFPNVWKNSGYSMAYSINIRLWNPSPGNQKYTDKYIIGPLAALILLGIPISEEGYSYSWPFFNKIQSKGLFFLNPSVLTNITVTRGGEAGQIAWNQSMGMADVRLDFTSLYGSFVVDAQGDDKINRPTLRSYINTLRNPREFTRRYSSNPTGENIKYSSPSSSSMENASFSKGGTTTKSTTNESYETAPTNRVSPSLVEKESALTEDNQLVKFVNKGEVEL